MALFFDARWFDARLAARSLSRKDLSAAIGATTTDIALIFKDQMEVTAPQVRIWAGLLNVSAEEIALRCGVSTPSVDAPSDAQKITALESRITILERQVAALIMQQGPQFR